jgi:hypothetical protein
MQLSLYLTNNQTTPITGVTANANYQKLDMYLDETIDLTSKLSDIEKLSNVFIDVTNTFSLPASGVNDALFKYYWDIDNDGTFNANIRVLAYIEIDSLPLRFGTLQLEGVTLKNGRPDVYKITFYGGLLQITDIIGDDTLAQLDYVKDDFGNLTKRYNNISQFDFEYIPENVTKLIDGSPYKDGLIIPLIHLGDKEWNYGTNVNNSVSQDIKTINGAVDTGTLRPALKVREIFNAIQQKYDLNFTTQFLGEAQFNNLYIWLNQQTEDKIYREVVNIFNPLSGTPDAGNAYLLDNYVYITRQLYTIFSSVELVATVTYNIVPTVPTATYNAYLVDENGDTVKEWLNISGTQTLVKEWKSEFAPFGNDTLTTTEQVRLEIEPSQTIDFDVNLNVNYRRREASEIYILTNLNSNSNSNIVYVTIVISENLPNMKVIDFIQGIMKMFKLIIRPITTNIFEFTTLDNYYAGGSILNISNYIDNSSTEIMRPEIYKKIELLFEKTNNVLGARFRRTNDAFNNKIGYGDLVVDYSSVNSKNNLEVKLPFENMLFERMQDESTLPYTLTKILYGESISVNDKGVISQNNSKPILFYNNGRVTIDPIKFKFNDGEIFTTNTSYLIGNTDDEILSQVTNTVNWGSENDPWHQSRVDNSLYLNYWSNWVNTIYNLKQRKFTFNAILPPRFVQELSLNDTLIIGSNRYKINDFQVNLNNGETKLTLFKDIFSWNEYSFPNPVPDSLPFLSTELITMNSGVKYYGINILKNIPWSVSLVDIGFGTSGVTLTTLNGDGAGECVIRVENNSTGAYRETDVLFDFNGTYRSVRVHQNSL